MKRVSARTASHRLKLFIALCGVLSGCSVAPAPNFLVLRRVSQGGTVQVGIGSPSLATSSSREYSGEQLLEELRRFVASTCKPPVIAAQLTLDDTGGYSNELLHEWKADRPAQIRPEVPPNTPKWIAQATCLGEDATARLRLNNVINVINLKGRRGDEIVVNADVYYLSTIKLIQSRVRDDSLVSRLYFMGPVDEQNGRALAMRIAPCSVEQECEVVIRPDYFFAESLGLSVDLLRSREGGYGATQRSAEMLWIVRKGSTIESRRLSDADLVNQRRQYQEQWIKFLRGLPPK